MELAFSSTLADTYILDGATYDRCGRLGSDRYLVDRPGDAADPLREYFESQLGFMGGGLSSMPVLTAEPHRIVREINEWLRFDKPGKYRMYVTSHRLSLVPPAKDDGQRQLTSNVVEFEILPADPDWAARELAAIVKELDAEKPGTFGKMEARRRLRFLGTEAAVPEMVRRIGLGDVNGYLEFGLIGSPHRAAVIRELEAGLEDPAVAVSSRYLYVLALLAHNRKSPELPRPAATASGAEFKKYYELLSDRSKERDKLVAEYLLKMARSVLKKQGPARAASLQALLFANAYAGAAGGPELPAELVRKLPAELAGVFAELDPSSQASVLEHSWHLVKCPEMLAPLRRAYENAPKDNWHIRTVALRRLYELDPEAGRKLILEEIRKPEPRAGIQALGLLPEKTLPEIDEVLAANLEKARMHYDLDKICPLIERYATGAILPRVRAALERSHAQWTESIQAALLAYCLRVDPKVGGELLAAALADRGERQPDYYRRLLPAVAALRPDPEVEKVALAALDDPDTEVASRAAQALQKCGSAAAEQALWKRFEKWHEQWKDRARELDWSQYAPGRMPEELVRQRSLGTNLAQALARGMGWLADRPKLERIQKLCVDAQDAQQIGYLIGAWAGQIPLRCTPDFAGGIKFEIAQYDCPTIATAKAKLAQFPKGTAFSWSASFNRGDREAETKQAFAELKAYLEDRGMKLDG